MSCDFGVIRQQVAGQLIAQKLVVRQVAVEGVDHPIAPQPHVAAAVDRVAVGVGVAGCVEPIERHPFAEVRTGEQAIDQPFVGIGAWSATNASTSSADGGRPVRSSETRRARFAAIGFRRGLQSFRVELCENERIDFVARPGLVG